ncbi:pyrimidine reductase family protein [Amycolatopsis jejuensis]|uniref:pyrimidine reductase family protein n=1 Tax=Amycolatopsis jejuensis TaxID=330084 RepID=UPI000AA54DDE|nr:pyrimidine reductase family protein [Amycolatopsis jejuensis]
MREIFPGTRDLTDAEVEQRYVYPDGPRWLAVNFVSSADGGITIDGRSGGLSTPADRVVYRLGNDLADVVLVGSGTAMAEGFEGMRPNERTAERRRRHGLAPIAPVAVVSTGRSLPPDAPVITKAAVPTIVITSAATDPALRAAWARSGADVLLAGTGDPALHEATGDPALHARPDEPRPHARHGDVDLRGAIDELARRGLRRIDCEGGPHLFASLLAAGVVDELRLTIAPMLVAGDAPRVAMGAGIDPQQLELLSIIEDDGSLLLRYRVQAR